MTSCCLSICWLSREASEDIGNVRATRLKGYGSLHHHVEESCAPTRDSYLGLVQEQTAVVLNYYIFRAANVTLAITGEILLFVSLGGAF